VVEQWSNGNNYPVTALSISLQIVYSFAIKLILMPLACILISALIFWFLTSAFCLFNPKSKIQNPKLITSVFCMLTPETY
jgi:hypothetical protein